ncbi:MAG: hypothetical protein ACK44H_08325 [Candidatus Kryptonium sp.]
MRHRLQIRFFVALAISLASFNSFADVKEALKFAREGIDRAVEIAPKVKKRKSFDSRNYHPGEKIFYKVSVKRDTTGDLIIKSIGFSGIDEATIEIKLSKIERIEALEKAALSAWGMLDRKNFIKADKKTDKVEVKIGNYMSDISVKFEGSEYAEIKIAKIKIVVKNPDEEFEMAVIQAIRRYRVSDGSFI